MRNEAKCDPTKREEKVGIIKFTGIKLIEIDILAENLIRGAGYNLINIIVVDLIAILTEVRLGRLILLGFV